ncbi:MAG: hypothetical protein Q8P41_14675 [Pseudomonadota bacterium]|nr:hypothetical protein [Pseudomonadota bacterium]
MPTSTLDEIPAGLLLLGLTLLLLGASEVGRWLARRSRAKEESKDHTNVLLGALLALLGLMLAFSFSIVEARYEARKQLVLKEANAIGTTWLRAGLVSTPDGARLRELLREYVASRTPGSGEHYSEALARSEELHAEMWTTVTRIANDDTRSITWLIIGSVNEIMELHEERVAISLYYRLPQPILWTMLMVAALALLVQGFSTGLGGFRTLVPTLALVVAIAAVMWLILELDEPWQRLAEINQQALVDVEETMSGRGPGSR